MKQQVETRKYQIDATGKRLGRLASEIAQLLLGKDKADFAKNVVAPVVVEVTNASKLDIDIKKQEEKKYVRYSGYPGGLKESTMSDVIEKKGYSEVLRKAVYGMIPGNKLRDPRMKNLIIIE